MSNLFVISAPSGAGKSSLIKALLPEISHISLSISHTTRTKRSEEIEGVDYFFNTIDEIKKLINDKELLEYAEVFGNYYGTSKSTLLKQLEKNDVILEIDWQGHQQVKKHFPNAISIFILPPSLQELENRLTNRGQDEKSIIDGRMKQAKNEIKHYDEYDFLIINEDFKVAVNALKNIILTNRLNLNTQKKQQKDLLESFK
jgi:guanylate kinase